MKAPWTEHKLEVSISCLVHMLHEFYPWHKTQVILQGSSCTHPAAMLRSSPHDRQIHQRPWLSVMTFDHFGHQNRRQKGGHAETLIWDCLFDIPLWLWQHIWNWPITDLWHDLWHDWFFTWGADCLVITYFRWRKMKALYLQTTSCRF